MSENEIDVEAIAEKWLQQCGSCDAGLPMGCACPTEDYRPAMSALLDEVEALREQVARVRKECADLIAMDDTSKWGEHGKSFAARRVLAALDATP